METSFAAPHVLGIAVPEGTPRRWLAACHQVSTSVEHLDATTALLDLGLCSAPEAWRVTADLLARLRQDGVIAQAAIAPNMVLAQLAVLQQPAGQPLACLTPAQAPALVAKTPVQLLMRVHPAGHITPEIVTRLESFGLRTLGHLARLGERALCQQFGDVGGRLATIARGEPLRPVQPTPSPMRHVLVLRLPAEGLPLAQVEAALPALWRRLEAWLARTDTAVGEVRLQLGWVSGGEQRARRLFHEATGDITLLAREGARLLEQLTCQRQASSEALVDTCQVTVARSVPIMPAQQVLWAPTLGRHEAVAQLAEVLRVRHGKSLLTQALATAKAAIYDEQHFAFVPYGQVAGAPAPATPRARVVRGWDDVPQRLHWW